MTTPCLSWCDRSHDLTRDDSGPIHTSTVIVPGSTCAVDVQLKEFGEMTLLTVGGDASFTLDQVDSLLTAITAQARIG